MAANSDSDDRPFGTLPTARERPRPTPEPRTSGTVRLEPGFMLGKYRIVGHLGAGGMGAVYEALHVDIGKPVALKVLNRELAADPRAQARFLQEAAAVSKLRHPHVVNVTDYGTQDGVPYIVMELLRGEDLADHLDHHLRGLSVEAAVDILLAICAGVSAAHQAGIIHRDLKPRNIFLDRSAIRGREPKVLDFGISKLENAPLSASLTDAGAVMGTTHYMSPEQVLGQVVDFRTDQYALGVVLYECLTGRRPHEGDTMFVVIRSIGEGAFVPPSTLRPDLPPALEAVILRAMARRPADRFPSVHAFGAALLPFASTKKRVHWTDYYTRDPLDVSLGGGDGPPVSAPLMAQAALLAKTVKLPENLPAPPDYTRSAGGPASDRPAGTPGTDQERQAVKRGEAVQPLSPSPRSARRYVAAGVLALVAGAAFLLLRDQGGAGGIQSAPIPLSVREPSPQPVPRPATEPPRPERDEVTIDVTDGPAGLIATIDGHETTLPLRLPREARSRVVVFQAPGFEPREVTIDARQDQTLSLRMSARRVRHQDRPPPKARRATPKTPRPPAQKGDHRPDTPPPFMDL